MKLVNWGVIFLVLVLVTIFILPGVGATQNNPPSDNTLCDNNPGSSLCNIQQPNPQCDRDQNRHYCDWHGDDPWCKNHQQGRNFVSIKNATVAASYLIGQIPSQIADFSEWNGATVVENTTYYDMNGVETAYSFDVMVNGQYDGYIMVSASRDNYPILEFSKGITPDKDQSTLVKAEQLANDQITRPQEVLGEGQPIYFGPTYFDMAYPIELNSTRSGPQSIPHSWILVDLLEGTVVNQSAFTDNVFQLNSSQLSELQNKQILEVSGANAAWAAIENSQGTSSASAVTGLTHALALTSQTYSQNSNEIADVSFYHWKYGCSPTAASMVLGYWRDQGLSQLPVDTDSTNDDQDHGDPLNYQLALFMRTTVYGDGTSCTGYPWDCGNTWPWNIAPGINAEFNLENIAGWNVWDTFFDSYNTMTYSIDSGFPLELSMDGGNLGFSNPYGGPGTARPQNYGDHSVAVVGYQDVPYNFLEIHDTWTGNEPYYILYGNWSAEMITRVMPVTTYTITASAEPNGAISPSGTITVFPAFSKTYTITPNPGYVIADVQVDGSSVGAVSSYPFSDIQASHTISATFQQLPSTTSSSWDWSTQGWGNWQYSWSVSGTQDGSNSPLGPEIDNGVGVFGTNNNLLAGSTQSSVTETFIDPTGVGYNTLTFNGALGASDVPSGRWMTITVNGQQVFGATELDTPPGDSDQPFTITAAFPQTSSATVTISQGQNPAWGPDFAMSCIDLTLSNENTQASAMMASVSTPKTTFTIPNGSEWAGNTTTSSTST